MAYDEHGNWVPDSESMTPAGYSGTGGYLWGMGNRDAGGLSGVYDMFLGEGDWGSGWQDRDPNRYGGSGFGADDPAWMSWLGQGYYDPGDPYGGEGTEYLPFVGGPQQMANQAYQQYLRGNEYRTPTAQDIGHGIYGRVMEGKRWDELWPGSGSTPATNGNDFSELKFNPADWDSFNRWAHEGAPTGGLERTGHYDTSRFTGPVTKDSPLWEAGGFVGGDRYEPTIGSGNMLHWSDFNPNVSQKTPLFLEGGPVDTGAIRGGFTPTTTEQQTEGQRWLDQLTGAYDEYQKTPYATFASTATTPGLQAQQQQWNTAADEYNRRVMEARNYTPTLTDQQQCEARGPEWQWNGSACVPVNNTPQTGAEECASRGAPWVWDGTRCYIPEPSNNNLQQQCVDAGGRWDGAECHFDKPTNNLPTGGNTSVPGIPKQPGIGELGETGITKDTVPFIPSDYEDAATHEVADDPLSNAVNLAAEGLIQGGGRIRTPLSAQTDLTLSDIMASGGELPLTADEQQRQDELDLVLSQGGVSDATPLEDEALSLIRELIDSGGKKPLDEQRRAMEIETARSPIDMLRRSQLAQSQAAMADRNILGSGAEADYMERLESQLAPMYADAGQQIALEEKNREDQRYNAAMAELSQQAQFQRASADERYAMAQELRTSMALDTARRQDERLMNAINQSANLTESQSRNLVDTINAVTGVQDMRVQSALDVLDRNIEWQMFLAEFGLKRDQVMEMIDQQRFAELMPLLNAYAEAIKIGTAGWRTQGSRT